MGSRNTIFTRPLKRVTTLASILAAVSGMVVTASAQTAQYQPLNQTVRSTSHSQDLVQDLAHGTRQFLREQENVARLASRTYASGQVQNSARIIRPQSAFVPPVRQQATVNRRALVGQGRMISAGFRQEPSVLGTLPQKPGKTVLQKEDPQDIFGDNQAIPTIPRNTLPEIPAPTRPQDNQLPDGALPSNVFENPFKNEQRPQPNNPTIVPGQLEPEVPENPPNNNSLEDPKTQQNPNPFTPSETDNPNDNQIDYQPGRGFNTTRSRTNVYRAPGSDDALQSREGVYFVPAYDPIPGTHQPTLAPPAAINPEYHALQPPVWPNQYAPQQPQYQQPQYQQPQYQQPHFQQPPATYPPSQPPQYTQPQQYAQPPQFAPATQPPQQQVYSSVVQPAANPSYGKGPMSPIRLGLFGKIKQDLKNDWGFGDYESCQNAGNCSGCDSGCGSSCGSTCPVFYLGFQGAWNDAFDVSNGQGTELVLDDGTAFFFSLGRMNGRNLRTEIELSFRDNNISSILTPDAELPFTGQLQTFSGMANLYWEFVDFPAGRFKPYFGGGVGFLSATTDLRLPNDPLSSGDQSNSSSSFAYQWMAGVNFKVSNHLDLYGEYRFVDAESFGISSDNDDLSGNFGYSANSVGGGFRWKF